MCSARFKGGGFVGTNFFKNFRVPLLLFLRGMLRKFHYSEFLSK